MALSMKPAVDQAMEALRKSGWSEEELARWSKDIFGLNVAEHEDVVMVDGTMVAARKIRIGDVLALRDRAAVVIYSDDQHFEAIEHTGKVFRGTNELTVAVKGESGEVCRMLVEHLE